MAWEHTFPLQIFQVLLPMCSQCFSPLLISHYAKIARIIKRDTGDIYAVIRSYREITGATEPASG
jgi:hypothetical protein